MKKDFSELRHKFSIGKIDKYRKSFYKIKNCKYLSTAEIITNLEESVMCKNFYGDDDYNE